MTAQERPGAQASEEVTAARRSWPMVVLTAVDRVFAGESYSAPEARLAVDVLQERGIPIICVTSHPADAVRTLRRALGEDAPLICRGGRELQIPHGYFAASPPPPGRVPPDVIQTTDVGHAVAIVGALFRTCQPEVMIVGIGGSTDHDLLAEVDVPIIVRTDTVPEWTLAGLDGAHVTHLRGVAGWSEAILGWHG